jgi:hypothetical protein
MIEYFTALSLLFLVIGHGLLIKKCTKLTDGLEPSAENLSSEMKGITSILDDIADLINDSLNFVANSPIAQTPNSPMEGILNGLISNMLNTKKHGYSQEPQDREIHEINPPTLETENESN